MEKNSKNFKENTKKYIKALLLVLERGEINQNSIIIAYYVLFSIFPIIIIIGNLLPLLQIDTKPISDYLSYVFPKQVSDFLMPIINGLLKKHSNGYISFGIIAAIWSFSGLIDSIRIAMNKIYGVYSEEKKKKWWHSILTRSITFIISAFMVIVFALIIFILIFGRQIMEFLSPIFNFSLKFIYQLEGYRWPIIFIVTILIITYLNLVLPNINADKRIIWPGIIVTTVSWTGLSYFFGIYLAQFGGKWQSYGIVGSLIIFMLWLNFVSLLLLFGVCLNAAAVKMKYGDAKYSTSHFGFKDHIDTDDN